MTASELRDHILDVIGRHQGVYSDSLEEYLRSFLAIISREKSKIPSYSLFEQIFEDAFGVVPIPFENNWLNYNEPPTNRLRLPIMQAKKRMYGWDSPLPTEKATLSDFECLYQTTLFQIADLRLIAQMPKEKKSSGYGPEHSPTGHEWENTELFAYLECGFAGLMDHLKFATEIPDFEKGNSWAILAYVLEWGRTYE